jgi:homoserine kinase type II
MGRTSIDLSSIWPVPPGCVLRPLGRGYNNLLYRLYAAGGEPLPFVLRVYGNHANPKYIQHEISVLKQLSTHPLPFSLPTPIPTHRGEFWALVDEGQGLRLMTLVPFLAGQNPDVCDVAHAEAAGMAMAQLHAALRQVQLRDIGLPKPYIELGKVHPLVPQPFEAMRMVGSLATKSDVARVEAILTRIFDCEKRFRILPQQLIHGDFIPGNLLAEGMRITAILDFENCALNPPLMDFAIAIDTWCWDAISSGQEWPRIAALARGYRRAGCLGEAEISLLPIGILLRNASVLMHLIGRFLANLSPYVDVEHWVAAMQRIDAWLVLYGERLIACVREQMNAEAD